jgi:UDP-N-acetylglucosamine--N-acetylmuramyl-(pentapeptide) pyrophosphoryl-undecaprenol N-acetylglucosamine transferase
MRVVIAGGGTAGHVQPAVALARALGSEEVSYVGTATGAEARLIPKAQLAFSTIDISGFDRARPLSLLSLGPRAARATMQARSVLHERMPDVVVGMGGYVSLPVCVAARSRGTSIVLHEQNAVLGLANRVCKPLAARVAVSWLETLPSSGRRGVFTGNPVLPEIAHLDRNARRAEALARFDLKPGRRTLLVFGGSQGARTINRAAVGLSERWKGRTDRQVLHIAGPGEFEVFQARVASGGELVYRIMDLLSEMMDAYSVADLVLCRGGATTVAELTATGLPAIIVPYPFHRDRQQERHAHVLASAGAAVMLPDAETTTRSVGDIADSLFDSEETLGEMARASLGLGHPDAAEHLAAVVREAAA